LRTGLDSAYPPTPAQIAAAKAAGYTSWSGYFAGPNILNGWSEADFANVMSGGMQTSAYCSGWADPVVMKNQAIAWGVPRIILDDESGIRSLFKAVVSGGVETTYAPSNNRRTARAMMHGGGPRPVLEFVNGLWRVSSWVQPWINSAGSGQYGNMPVFAGVSASCYVFAAYPGGDPGASWPPYYPRPADGNPCAWQYQGTTTIVGHSVDLTHYDDNFWAFGPRPQQIGDEDMLYVGPFTPLTATLKVFSTTATMYSDPSPNALPMGSFPVGSSLQVRGFLYSSQGIQSSDRGGGAGPGMDLVWWQGMGDNQWFSDDDLITTGIAGAPIGAVLSTLPSGAKLYLARESELASIGGGVTLAQVDTEVQKALAALPPGVTMAQVQATVTAAIAGAPLGLTKDQVDAEILTALGNFKPPAAPPSPHHHNVLGIINTGPAVADLS
jgi:hypothetical protein